MYIPASKQRRSSRGSSTPVQINIAPLVDVMLVLMVIFMVTAPMLTVGVPVDLPKTEASQMNDQNDDPLVITLNDKGEVYLQETPLSLDALAIRLKAVRNHNADAKIYIRADQKLSYGKVMEIMGILTKSGCGKVSLITTPQNGASEQTSRQDGAASQKP